jgi:hypothetical protein
MKSINENFKNEQETLSLRQKCSHWHNNTIGLVTEELSNRKLNLGSILIFELKKKRRKLISLN